jgi:hypothetical protein
MTGVPPSNPITVANMASNLARYADEPADARMFQRIAMISMITCAAGSFLTIAVPIIKDLLRSRQLPDDHFSPRHRSRSR